METKNIVEKTIGSNKGVIAIIYKNKDKNTLEKSINETIDILGGKKVELHNKDTENYYPYKHHCYNFPGQEGTISLAVPTEESMEYAGRHKISGVIGLMDFDNNSFYKKLISALYELKK